MKIMAHSKEGETFLARRMWSCGSEEDPHTLWINAYGKADCETNAPFRVAVDFDGDRTIFECIMEPQDATFHKKVLFPFYIFDKMRQAGVLRTLVENIGYNLREEENCAGVTAATTDWRVFCDFMRKNYMLGRGVEVSAELRNAMEKALCDYVDRPVFHANEQWRTARWAASDEYIGFYLAIDDPSRVGAVHRSKMSKFLDYWLKHPTRNRQGLEDNGSTCDPGFWTYTLDTLRNIIAFGSITNCVRKGYFGEQPVYILERDDCRKQEMRNWLRDNGTFVKTGKFVATLVSKEQTEAEISQLAGNLGTILLSSATSADDLDRVKVSDTPSYIYVTSTCGGSCMSENDPDDDDPCNDCNWRDEYGELRCDECAHDGRSGVWLTRRTYADPATFYLYDKIPTCKIAYVEGPDGTIDARAILWEEVRDIDGNTNGQPVKFMDTVYAENNKLCGLMIAWAEANGYYHKALQHWRIRRIVGPNDNYRGVFRINSRAYVDAGFTMRHGSFDCVPFVDTFRFTRRGSRLLGTTAEIFLYTGEERKTYNEGNNFNTWERANWNTVPEDVACMDSTEGDGEFLTHGNETTCKYCHRAFGEDEERHIERSCNHHSRPIFYGVCEECWKTRKFR